MLKGKIKLPDKFQIKLPHNLSILFPGFEDKEEEQNSRIDKGCESGEELEMFHPNSVRLNGEIDVFNLSCDEKSDNCISEVKVAQRHRRGIDVIKDDEKRSDLEYEVSQKDINLEKLQRAARSGIPDGGSLRATIWKLLLGNLPASRDLWEKELAENRLKYNKLKEDLLLSPSEHTRRQCEAMRPNDPLAEKISAQQLERKDVSVEDHPLCLGRTSVWHQYFKFSEISDQIDRDLQRTHPDIEFFSEKSTIGKKHKECLRNILILFAKLNPEIGYVQGMNEVLAPLFYVFSTDSDERNAVNPQFYAFRWITLLLAQEFSLQAIFKIWDCLLSNPLGVQRILGDGKNTLFWEDNWHDFGNLNSGEDAKHLQTRLNLKGDATVAEAVVNGRWKWEVEGRRLDEKCKSFVRKLGNAMVLGSKQDQLVWVPGKTGIFSLKSAVESLNPEGQELVWPVYVWWQNRIPRHAMAAWLACWKRLPTQDRLCKWGIVKENKCWLCKMEEESHEHLFFSCNFSYACWENVMRYIGCSLDRWINNGMWDWLRLKPWKSSLQKDLLLLSFAACIYMIWWERNVRRTGGREREQSEICDYIKNQVRLYVGEWRNVKKSKTNWQLCVSMGISTRIFDKASK